MWKLSTKAGKFGLGKILCDVISYIIVYKVLLRILATSSLHCIHYNVTPNSMLNSHNPTPLHLCISISSTCVFSCVRSENKIYFLFHKLNNNNKSGRMKLEFQSVRPTPFNCTVDTSRLFRYKWRNSASSDGFE